MPIDFQRHPPKSPAAEQHKQQPNPAQRISRMGQITLPNTSHPIQDRKLPDSVVVTCIKQVKNRRLPKSVLFCIVPHHCFTVGLPPLVNGNGRKG